MLLDRVKGTRYKQYLLLVLGSLLACNFVDRLALGLVLQDIKIDLGLSDTQLGLVSGIAFALFYSVMGIPIARWADRGNRVTIISLTAASWSVMVSLCGTVGSFAQLLLVRAGVAVGEAGCIPPAHSLIADVFNRDERPRAMSRYMLGAPLSVVMGYFVAGWLNELYGWRAMFAMLGAPGVVLAVLAWITLREPRRVDAHSSSSVPTAHRAGLVQIFATLWAIPSFRHLLFCFSAMAFFGAGILQWQPTFFVRSHGLETGELGTWFAALTGMGGFAGTYLGGELVARHAANNEALQLKAMAVGYCAFAVLSMLIYLASSRYLAFGCMALVAIGVGMANGPFFATLQTLVPEHMRAQSIAILYLFANLIGMGLGPLAAGMLSDGFRAWAGEESLRYALLILSSGYLWGAWHFWRAGRTVLRDLEASHPSLAADPPSCAP